MIFTFKLMPQVNIVRDELFKAVGKTFTDEQFEDLCFEYGLEMEMGNGTEMNMTRLDAAGNNIDMSKVNSRQLNRKRIDTFHEGVNSRFVRIEPAWENNINTGGTWVDKFRILIYI